MTEENEVVILNPKKPKKRGAPIGNHNAVKHGFYSRLYTQAEVTDLSDMEILELDNEIELVRTLMRRVLASARDNTSHVENIETLRAICLGNFTLTRLIRTHFLKPKDKIHPIHEAIQKIIEELDAETALKKQELENDMRNVESQTDNSIFKWEY